MGREQFFDLADGRLVEGDEGQLLRPPRAGGENRFQGIDDRSDAF